MNEQRDRVRKAEEAVEHFKAENNIVGSTGRLVHEQHLTDLNNQLTNLVATVKQIEQFEAAQKQFNGTITNLTHAAVETPATLPTEKSGK